MAVLLVLLFLSNLWFGWAVGSTGSPNSSTSTPDLGKILSQLQDERKKKEETCAKVRSALVNLATSKNWKVKAEHSLLSIELPNGKTFVINKDCSKTFVKVPTGTLRPPQDSALASHAQGMLMKADFKFRPDVRLFRVLFLMLMYAAGIFWVVRAAQRLIAGELTEMLITFFTGFVIVAIMYVLYRMM